MPLQVYKSVTATEFVQYPCVCVAVPPVRGERSAPLDELHSSHLCVSFCRPDACVYKVSESHTHTVSVLILSHLHHRKSVKYMQISSHSHTRDSFFYFLLLPVTLKWLFPMVQLSL